MPWHARLQLDYRADHGATRLDFRHDGPLRILKSLYPEGEAVCHNVVVHPPGGLVGGDTLSIDLALPAGTHALLTTPGATRFYRSAQERARQEVEARVDAGARLEWLPLEALVHSGARADNALRVALAPGAEMIGWDCVALGLPAAGAPFVVGDYRHELAVGTRWLDRGRTAADDAELLDGPCGWAGQRALGTLWFAAGTALAADRREALLEAARALIDGGAGAPAPGPPEAPGQAQARPLQAGASAPQAEVVAVRVLAPRVEPVFELMTAIWRAWRPLAWGLAPCAPRVWKT